SGSTAALHVAAKGDTGSGTGFGADFVYVASPPKLPFDASGYTGITFYAKIVSGTRGAMHFLVPDSQSDPDGKKCSGTGVNQCYADPGTSFTFTTSWAPYTAKFCALRTEGWGSGGVRALSAAQIFGLKFNQSGSIAALVNFDLLFDDIAFISN